MMVKSNFYKGMFDQRKEEASSADDDWEREDIRVEWQEVWKESETELLTRVGILLWPVASRL